VPVKENNTQNRSSPWHKIDRSKEKQKAIEKRQWKYEETEQKEKV